MDLLQGVKDGLGEKEKLENLKSFEDAPMPTREELLKLLDGLTGMSDEDKEDLRNSLLGSKPPKFDGENAFFGQWMLLLLLLAFIGSIFVFFGYKLYKSLKQKEQRREEKKMMKQMKKKK